VWGKWNRGTSGQTSRALFGRLRPRTIPTHTHTSTDTHTPLGWSPPPPGRTCRCPTVNRATALGGGAGPRDVFVSRTEQELRSNQTHIIKIQFTVAIHEPVSYVDALEGPPRAAMHPHRYSIGRLSLEALEHRERCKKLPPLRPGECERLIAAYLEGRSITACPTRFAGPVHQLIPETKTSIEHEGERISWPR